MFYAVRSGWHQLCEQLRFNWHVLVAAMSYYASMRVIFYTEVAVIMLCCVDLSLTVTLLGVMASKPINYVLTYTRWAVFNGGDEYMLDQIFTLVLAFYLLESIVRIHYCLKLAYHHNCKVLEGELCCMKCHDALMSAAMSNVYILTHFVSGLCMILYFIWCHVRMASVTASYNRAYFVDNPFLGRGESDAMRTSMFYKLGVNMMTDVSRCRFNTNVSIGASVQQLLSTGQLFSLVDYKCAVQQLHCTHARFYLQLSIESVYALINYTVIRCLIGHVINMHQYEVYNLQTRLQSSGGSRLIRVYRVRHMKSSRGPEGPHSSMMQLPRQALVSLINLGTNVATRLRNSGPDPYAMQEAQMSPKEMSHIGMLEDGTGEEFQSLDTDSQEAPWSYGHDPLALKTTTTTTGQPNADAELDAAATAALYSAPPHEAPAAADESDDTEQQLQTVVLNRREATNAKKVNFEQLKIGDLYHAASMVRQADHRDKLSTKEIAALVATKRLPTASSRSARNRKVNDTIFTDETFYSLETST